MDARHETHLEVITAMASQRIRNKYRNGQVEHGGNLWEKRGLLDMAIEEAIDQVIYLLTLKQQMIEAGVELGRIREEEQAGLVVNSPVRRG